MRDRAIAMALSLAEKKLISLDYNWHVDQIGTLAAEIIKAFDAEMARKEGE